MRQACWPRRYALALVVVFSALSGCVPSSATPREIDGSGSASPRSSAGPASIDCTQLLRLTPPEASDALEEYGYVVSWRLVHTNPDGTTTADVVADAPSGTIVDIILEDGHSVVFVAGEDAPSPSVPPTC